MSFAIIFTSSTGKLRIKILDNYIKAKEVQDTLATWGVSSELRGV